MRNLVFIVLFCILACIPIYFAGVCLISFCKKIITYPKTEKHGHYAILIPCRNEEKVVGNLVASLMKLNYPRDCYRVYVLLNQCSDHSKEIVEKYNVHTIELEHMSSKGQVLKAAFKQLQDDSWIDAFVVFDSDNLVHPDFLVRMNEAYQSGYQILQGRRTGKNVQSSLISNCYEVFYILQNIFFNHSRVVTGASASINGTAWLVSKKYILENGYDTKTMVEDVEFMALAAMYGLKIGYVHEAITYDEYPTNLSRTIKQLRRWIFGQVQCMRYYTIALFKNAIVKKNRPALDMGIIFAMPCIVIVAIVGLILYLCSIEGSGLWLWNHLFVILLVLYIVVVVFVSSVVVKSKTSFHSLWKGVLCFPFFMLLWVFLMPTVLFKKQMVWEPIVHDTSKKIEDMKS